MGNSQYQKTELFSKAYVPQNLVIQNHWRQFFWESIKYSVNSQFSYWGRDGGKNLRVVQISLPFCETPQLNIQKLLPLILLVFVKLKVLGFFKCKSVIAIPIFPRKQLTSNPSQSSYRGCLQPYICQRVNSGVFPMYFLFI